MTDLETFLDAIEAEPTDDARWLVFADWLEERGNPTARGVRWVVEKRKWKDAFRGQMRKLDRRQLRLLACDCVERVLPLFERRYPDDPAPRRLVDLHRLYASGSRVKAAQDAVNESCRVARRDAIRDPDGSLLALGVAEWASWIGANPAGTCFDIPLFAIGEVFGASAYAASGQGGPLDPAWRAVRDASYRWQLARLLRFRPGALGDQSGVP